MSRGQAAGRPRRGSRPAPGRPHGLDRPPDRGAGTLLVVAVVAVLLVVAVAAGRLAHAVNERSVAQTAADLAALAGAAAAVDPVGSPDPCAVVGRVATANGVLLVACGVGAGGTVTVTTRRGEATAEARAGPVAPNAASAPPGRFAEVPPAVGAAPAS